jgi:hypothetical protein
MAVMKKSATRKAVKRRAPVASKTAAKRTPNKRTAAKPRRTAKRQAPRTAAPAKRATPAGEMHAAAVTGLKKWVSGLDDQAREQPLVAAAGTGGTVITPQSLVHHVERGTSIGQRYFENIQQLAVDQVLRNFGPGKAGSGGGEF